MYQHNNYSDIQKYNVNYESFFNVSNTKTIGIVIICTNAYFILGLRFVKKFINHYRGKFNIVFYLFTDTDPKPYSSNINNLKYINTIHENWQDSTNSKFKNIISIENEKLDYIYYFDADTNIYKDFTEEWFLGDLVGGVHYNNCFKTNGILDEKPYDRNILSKAYIPFDTKLPQTYYYGAFFGGIKNVIINFCKQLYNNQICDKLIPYEPIWNDESYINNYFHYNPPSFIIPSEKFLFEISNKGGFDNLKNSQLNIDIYKNIILNNNTLVFDIYNKNIMFAIKDELNYTMYGPYIEQERKIQLIKNLTNGENVYIIEDDIYTKMVTKSGVAKYYIGKIDKFNSLDWCNYIDVGDNYKINYYQLYKS